MTLQCVVLAGGQGTRMRPLTETMPKALVPVLGRPFVEWQLELLAAQGIEWVVYSLGYRGDMLRAQVGDGSRFGLSITYVDEGERRLGTAGALRFALDERVLDPEFFVLYGDSYLPVDFASVEEAWRTSGLPALMTVMRNEGRWDASNAIYEAGKVVVYDKSRPERWRSRMHWIDYGLSVLSRDLIATHVPSGGVSDLAELMRTLSESGQLAGYEAGQRFYEAGSPEGLRDLEDYLAARSGGDGGASIQSRPQG